MKRSFKFMIPFMFAVLLLPAACKDRQQTANVKAIHTVANAGKSAHFYYDTYAKKIVMLTCKLKRACSSAGPDAWVESVARYTEPEFRKFLEESMRFTGAEVGDLSRAMVGDYNKKVSEVRAIIELRGRLQVIDEDIAFMTQYPNEFDSNARADVEKQQERLQAELSQYSAADGNIATWVNDFSTVMIAEIKKKGTRTLLASKDHKYIAFQSLGLIQKHGYLPHLLLAKYDEDNKESFLMLTEADLQAIMKGENRGYDSELRIFEGGMLDPEWRVYRQLTYRNCKLLHFHHARDAMPTSSVASPSVSAQPHPGEISETEMPLSLAVASFRKHLHAGDCNNK